MTPAVGQHVLVHKGLDAPLGCSHAFQGRDIDFDVEMAAVGQDGAVLHPANMRLVDYITLSRHRNEDIADFGGVQQRHDLGTVHGCLQRADGVYLADDDVAPMPLARRATPRPQ